MLDAGGVADANLAFLVQKIFALRERTLAELGLLDRLALRHDDLPALDLPLDVVFGVRLGLAAGDDAVTALGGGFQARVVARDRVLAPQGGLGEEHHAGRPGPADVTDRL